MLWWIPIAVAGMACLGVLTVVASTAAGRHEGRHVLTDPQEEWDAYMAEGRSYGSMVLAEEQHHEEWLPAPPVDPAPWLEQTRAELSPESLGDDEPLSPPPLSHPVWRNPKVTPDDLPDDSGPGATSSLVAALGPVPSFPVASESHSASPGIAEGALQVAPAIPLREVPPSRWLAEQLDILRAWAERQQAYAEILA